MNKRIKELALQSMANVRFWNAQAESYGVGHDELAEFAELVEAAARADERDFIATKWENLYGYDKQGVAEFIRKRANTQGEQHEQTN